MLPAEEKKTLAVCGSKSGRDVDKIQECGLTLCYGTENAPFFREAEMVLVCRKLYVQDMNEACVLDQDIVSPFYGEHGHWHRAYTGQIVEVYTK